ncbi:MAG: hypothetical protein M1839_002347 [Geoglossum umbratile]|nr:MAG: hypothetical protein M1839_002347 [Geoglossum umbratile]
MEMPLTDDEIAAMAIQEYRRRPPYQMEQSNYSNRFYAPRMIRTVSEPPVNARYLWFDGPYREASLDARYMWGNRFIQSEPPYNQEQNIAPTLALSESSRQDGSRASEPSRSLTPGSVPDTTQALKIDTNGQDMPTEDVWTPKAPNPWAHGLILGTPRAGTPPAYSPLTPSRWGDFKAPPTPPAHTPLTPSRWEDMEVPPTPGAMSDPYGEPEVSVRVTYEHRREEVVSVVHRWFSNKWLDKLTVMNGILGWNLSYQKVRATLSTAKRTRKPGWAKVYDAKFDERHWWADLLEEMVRAGRPLGIELKLRQEEYEPNVAIHNPHRGARDHRWSVEQRTILCLIRTTYLEIVPTNVHLIMHNLFPDMTTSPKGITERFLRMKREDDPLWLALKDMDDEVKEEQHGDYMDRIHAATEQLGIDLE